MNQILCYAGGAIIIWIITKYFQDIAKKAAKEQVNEMLQKERERIR